jgi:hypothetical protein
VLVDVVEGCFFRAGEVVGVVGVFVVDALVVDGEDHVERGEQLDFVAELKVAAQGRHSANGIGGVSWGGIKGELGGESLAEVAIGKTSVFHTQREGDTKDKPQTQAENNSGASSRWCHDE